MRTTYSKMRVYTILALVIGLQMVTSTSEVGQTIENVEVAGTIEKGRVIHHKPQKSNNDSMYSSSSSSSTQPYVHHQKSGSLITNIFETLLENVERLVDEFLPIDYAEIPSRGGLIGDETSLAWGASTIEVVKTQASYLTRPAAFGPRIVEEDGLHGSLLPISEFYRKPSKVIEREEKERQEAQKKREEDGETEDIQDFGWEDIHKSLKIDNYGCPYKGGPGWHDDDQQNGGLREKRKLSESQMEAVIAKPPSDWIALVERGGKCSFVAKVRVAQSLGAIGVVVGDSPSNPNEHDGPLGDDPGLSGGLVTMYAPGDTKDVEIPSTFVTRPSYIDLIRLIDEQEQEEEEKRREQCLFEEDETACLPKSSGPKKGLKVILWRDDVMWEWPLIDLAFVLLMLPSFMTLITIVIHRIRMVQQRRRERAPEIAVLNLPCLIWRGNGQPWEKVEDAQMVGEGGNGLNAGKGSRSNESLFARTSGHISAFWSRIRGSQTRQDMELGGGENDLSQTETGLLSDSNEAGPSTLPSMGSTNSTVIKPLKTTPIAPPAPPPDRTYYSCDECAICLSDFVDGDLVRVLPCGHVFHLQEIDSWLTRVKKFCPICKRDITIVPPPAPPIPGNGASSSPTTPVGVENSTATVPTINLQPNEDEDHETGTLLVPDRNV